jgi:hypothetical protein
MWGFFLNLGELAQLGLCNCHDVSRRVFASKSLSNFYHNSQSHADQPENYQKIEKKVSKIF